MATGYQTTTDDVPAPLLKWGAIFGGLILGLAMLLLLSALWLALAYGSDSNAVAGNLEWYIGFSAIGSLFVGAILTGYLSGVPGAGTGMLHGFALWGLLIVVTVTVGIPSVLNVFGLQQIADQAVSGRLIQTGDQGALWASFFTILGGFVAAGFGGMIGGLVTRGGRRVVSNAVPAPMATRVVVPEAPTATAMDVDGRHVVDTDVDEDERQTTVPR
jgi:hypothetical protein